MRKRLAAARTSLQLRALLSPAEQFNLVRVRERTSECKYQHPVYKHFIAPTPCSRLTNVICISKKQNKKNDNGIIVNMYPCLTPSVTCVLQAVLGWSGSSIVSVPLQCHGASCCFPRASRCPPPPRHHSPVIEGPRLDKIALFCFSTEFDRKLDLLVSIKVLP